ncbi:hypothetical protein [Sorangium sp. So ce1024]|uniref:hypothetical protein n=1 Tax=Sorangium sp. So ce1024 TaxID=3133327 RepID=UPI003EFF4425
MRTRLVRIACLFTSAASIAAAGLGLASRPALAKETSTSARQTEKPSTAAPAEAPETAAASPKAAAASPKAAAASPKAAAASPKAAAASPKAAAASPKAAAASPKAGAGVAAAAPSVPRAKTDAKKAPEPPPLPPAPARVWLIAPTPQGPWTLRIDNEGERPMRIPADIRLLRLEIDTLNKRTKKTVRCAAPAGLKPSGFPERRALLLAPGQSYMEHFDPRLLCFGKDEAALAGGSVVRAWYGWGPPPKWSRTAPSPPFAVESTDDPLAFAPAQGLAAPTIVLSYDLPSKKDAAGDGPDGAGPPSSPGDKQAQPSGTTAQPQGDKAAQPQGDKAAQPQGDKTAQPQGDKTAQPQGDKAAQASTDSPAGAVAGQPAPSTTARGASASGEPIVDANAPRLELKSEPWSDAASPRSAVVRVTARNAGRRPMTVAIRSRMFEFHVAGPNGTTVCQASPPTGAIPRDMFRTLKPGASVDVPILLREVCPSNTLDRVGLYEVTARLHANEPGIGLGVDAYTATVTAREPTLLRLKSAPEPFYAAPPRSVPTPQSEPKASDAGVD